MGSKQIKNLIEFKKEDIEIRNDNNSKTTNIRSKTWNLALPVLIVDACIIQKKYLAIVTADSQHDILTLYKLPAQNVQKNVVSPNVASQSVALPGKLHKMVLTLNDYLILSLNSGKFYAFEF